MKKSGGINAKQPTGFLDLLGPYFDLNSFIPKSFTDKYYCNLGRDSKYTLTSILSALLILHIFNIPTTKLLSLFLVFSTEIRELCGFYEKVSDDSFFSRFKTNFENHIADLFDCLNLEIINICEKINADYDRV
ncbi:transposase [Clostridium tepidiprofundi]|uniref:transposase n=1 Tax=Clostridium tepidiprofundi TaxID=420412 RepID=UPI00128F4CA1